VTRPGLAKARGLPFVLARQTLVVRAFGPRWLELFEGADVVSEGSVRVEPGGRIWYGTTSLILPLPRPDPGEHDGNGAALFAAVAARDLHVRLRAVRLARREACLRAPGRLGRLSCEIQVRPVSQGVRIDVDVQAPLIERRAGTRAAR
jgi:hypothetical protein